MASNKIQRSGPIALTTTTTANLFNPPTLTGGTNVGGSNTYLIVRHIRVTNKHNTIAAKFALWLGLTGANTAGTEFAFGGIASGGTLTNGPSIPTNSYVDWYGMLAMEAADFLVGGSDTATALTINIEYEIGIR